MAESPPGRGEDLLAVSLLVGLLCFCFAPALGLPFGNADDFLHMNVAWAVLGLEPGALSAVVRGFSDADALRLVPWAVWTLDTAVFGWTAAGHFAVNIGLQVALSVAVYALGRRLGLGRWGAIVAGAWVGLNLATGQALYFLGGRDDQCAALMAVVAAASWPSLQSSTRQRMLGVALAAAACLSKPPAAVVVLLVVLVDGSKQAPAAPWRRWRPLLFVALSYGAVLLVLVGPGMLGGVAAKADAGAWRDPEMVRRIGALWAPGWSVRLPGRDLLPQSVPLLLAAGVGVFSAATRRGSARAARVGAIWLLLCLPVPLLWVSSQLHRGEDAGRQWLLASVGVALLVGSAWPKGRRLAMPLAAVMLAALGFRFSNNAGPFLERTDPTVARFLTAVRGVHGQPITVALQRPHAGLSALLTSGALQRVGGFSEPPRVLLQGESGARQAVWDPLGYGSLEEEPTPLNGLLGTVLVDGPVATHGAFRILWEDDPGRPGAVLQSWSFEQGTEGWSTYPPRLRSIDHEVGRGFQVRGQRTLTEGQVGVILGGGERPGALLSPELALDPHTVCGLRLDIEGGSARPNWRPMGAELVPGGLFSIVTWSEDADFRGGYQRSLVVPRGADVRLDHAPAWREGDWVRRIAVHANNVPEPVWVHGVELLGCEERETEQGGAREGRPVAPILPD
jgi:hypothetical protein